jgi:hypothetical protein
MGSFKDGPPGLAFCKAIGGGHKIIMPTNKRDGSLQYMPDSGQERTAEA